MTAQLADGNLWLHFTRTDDWLGGTPPSRSSTAARGATSGTRRASATSTVCRRCSASRSATAARRWSRRPPTQMAKLPFSTNWSYANQPSIDLAHELAAPVPRRPRPRSSSSTPGPRRSSPRSSSPSSTTGCTANPSRVKVISRNYAYHGTTLGALGVTGLAGLREPFEPLRPVHLYAPNTNAYRPQARRPRAGDRGLDPRSRSRERVAGHRRTGPERRRVLHPTGRLLAAAARDLRPLRRAARLRRGHHRLRSARVPGRGRRSTASSPTC